MCSQPPREPHGTQARPSALVSVLLLLDGVVTTRASSITFAAGQRHSFTDALLLSDTAQPADARGLVVRQQPPDTDYGYAAPLLSADAAWEKGCLVSSYSSVFQRHPGARASLFYELYCSVDPDQPMTFGAGAVAMVALAESVDGIAWTKPIVNRVTFRNTTRNNVVMLAGGSAASESELEGASVFRDPSSGDLVSVAALGTKLAVFTAADERGFDWKQKALWEVGFDDSQSVLFWDEPRAEYALYTRAKNGDLEHFPSLVR
jgi:hypothetical protein